MNKLRWDREFALEQAADDAELLQELIDIFKESSANDFRTIERGLSSEDAQAVYAASHSIKGAAASLGIDGIRDIALAIEDDSRRGSLAAAQARVGELEELLQQLQQL